MIALFRVLGAGLKPKGGFQVAGLDFEVSRTTASDRAEVNLIWPRLAASGHYCRATG